MQPVTLFISGNTLKHGYISVGDIVHILQIFHKLVAVLHYHQPVTPHETFLLELDRRPDSEIVFYGASVRPADDHDPVIPVFGIGIRQFLYQFRTVNPLYIVISPDIQGNIDVIRPIVTCIPEQLPQCRGILQYSGSRLLPYDRHKLGPYRFSQIRDIFVGQCGTDIQSHGRKLRLIPYQHQFVARPAPDIVHQVHKEIP